MSSDWIPLRWPCGPLDQERSKNAPGVAEALTAWLNPKTLSFLDGGPVNAIVVTWAAGSSNDAAQQTALQPIVAEAKKRKLAVIGRVTGKSPDAGKSAAAGGLSAIVADGSSSAPGLEVIPAVDAARVSPTDSGVIALAKTAWPRIPTQWRSQTGERTRGADAGPTGAPWVDSNGWRCSLAAAKAPGKTFWTMAEPPEDVVGYRPPHYALAVADSAVYGATWIVAFDADTRKSLAAGGAKESWKAVTDAHQFFRAHKAWLDQPTAAKLGVVSDFSGPNEFIGGETLNLMARRHLPYRILDRGKAGADSVQGLKAVLWLDTKAPDGQVKSLLGTFVDSGGLLIIPASASSLVSGTSSGSFESRYSYYASGKGRIALATKPWSDPWLLAADTHLLLGRKHDLIRTFNAGSCNVRYTTGAESGVAHLVNYTARPFGYEPSLFVAHPYKNARLSTLSGVNNEPIELKPKGEGVEVYLPQFAPYAAIEFGG